MSRERGMHMLGELLVLGACTGFVGFLAGPAAAAAFVLIYLLLTLF